MCLSFAIDEYRNRIGRNPSPESFKSFAEALYVEPAEHLSSNSVARISPHFDGLGGWWYEENGGRLSVNRAEPCEITKGCVLVPTNLVFAPRVHFGLTGSGDKRRIEARLLEIVRQANRDRPAVATAFTDWFTTNKLGRADPLAKP